MNFVEAWIFAGVCASGNDFLPWIGFKLVFEVLWTFLRDTSGSIDRTILCLETMRTAATTCFLARIKSVTDDELVVEALCLEAFFESKIISQKERLNKNG